MSILTVSSRLDSFRSHIPTKIEEHFTTLIAEHSDLTQFALISTQINFKVTSIAFPIFQAKEKKSESISYALKTILPGDYDSVLKKTDEELKAYIISEIIEELSSLSDDADREMDYEQSILLPLILAKSDGEEEAAISEINGYLFSQGDIHEAMDSNLKKEIFEGFLWHVLEKSSFLVNLMMQQYLQTVHSTYVEKLVSVVIERLTKEVKEFANPPKDLCIHKIQHLYDSILAKHAKKTRVFVQKYPEKFHLHGQEIVEVSIQLEYRIGSSLKTEVLSLL